MAGTVHGKADAVLDRRALENQLARIRDSAAALLDHLAAISPASEDAAPTPRATSPNGRSREKVDAPGKKHRKAPERRHGVAIPTSASPRPPALED
jgi:hypothetical protein